MFLLSLVFLINTAALIVVTVDVPRVGHTSGGEASNTEGPASAAERPAPGDAERTDSTSENEADHGTAAVLFGIALLLWPVFWIEMWLSRRGHPASWSWREFALVAICPPLRMGLPDPAMQGRLWLPGLGWCTVDDALRSRLERSFAVPMILIALMILPILIVELTLRDQIAEHLWLRVLLHVSTGTIWFAFALEFILMVSVAPRKLHYCKVHWMDLAIILLPLISFLRSLRLVRATRLARFARLQQLTKLARAYRLRGLALKGFRALLLFDLLYRLLRITPERRIRGLRAKLELKEEEVRELHRQIEELEQLLAAERDAEAATEP